MSVYVDDRRHPFGRMIMSHMVADTSDELGDMAETIGLREAWIQCPNTYKEHYDISQTKRAQAIEHGAVAVTARKLVEIVNSREET